MKKIFSFTLLSLSLLSLQSCIVAAIAIGAGSVAYIDGEYSMNMPGSVKDVYSATLRTIQENDYYTLLSTTISPKKDQVMGSTKADSKNFTITIEKITKNASKVSIRFGTFGDQNLSAKLMNKINSNIPVVKKLEASYKK